MGQQSAKMNISGHRTRDFIVRDGQLHPGQRYNESDSLWVVPHGIEKMGNLQALLARPIENSKDQRLTWKAA